MLFGPIQRAAQIVGEDDEEVQRAALEEERAVASMAKRALPSCESWSGRMVCVVVQGMAKMALRWV